jgi:hypothetical protein
MLREMGAMVSMAFWEALATPEKQWLTISASAWQGTMIDIECHDRV